MCFYFSKRDIASYILEKKIKYYLLKFIYKHLFKVIIFIYSGIWKFSYLRPKINTPENYDALLGAIIKAKPAAAKGQYVRSIYVSTTMSPSVSVRM